jgi:hypothetical protein
MITLSAYSGSHHHPILRYGNVSRAANGQIMPRRAGQADVPAA